MSRDQQIQKTQQKALAPIDQTKALLEKAKSRLAAVLPRHVSADKVIRMAVFAVSQSPYLAACRPESILTEVMRGAALGLDVGGVGGHAYLVPFKDEAKLVVGYKGYMELARRSGLVSQIEARAVFEGDHFAYQYGLEPRLEHVPVAVDRAPDHITHVYAVARFKDGTAAFEVLTRQQVEARRTRSAAVRAKKSTPWDTDYEAMARKSAVRALANFLPQSPEILAAIELDHREDRETSEPDRYIDIVDDVRPVPPPEHVAPPLAAVPSAAPPAPVQEAAPASTPPAPAAPVGEREGLFIQIGEAETSLQLSAIKARVPREDQELRAAFQAKADELAKAGR